MTGRPMLVDGADLDRQVLALRRVAPSLYDCLDLDRVRAAAAEPPTGVLDFGPEAAGGRGTSYVRAQEAQLDARSDGIARLVALIPPARHGGAVLDLLGGNGLIRRVNERHRLTGAEILTCDAAPNMVAAAWAAGAPALLQHAQRVLVRDASVVGVLLAYGTHHLSDADRVDVALEAHRALRPGGVFVLHDFETGSPMDEWFASVVDPWSATGHRYEHLTAPVIEGYFEKAGFAVYRVTTMPDPFVASGPTVQQARRRLGRYLVDMYGLVRAEAEHGPEDVCDWAAERADAIFRERADDGTTIGPQLSYDASARSWTYRLPRPALVGVAER